jgi:hypothetical protein
MKWLLTIKDKHGLKGPRTVVFTGKPSDRQVAFEKGSACYAWFCMPRELIVTLEETNLGD